MERSVKYAYTEFINDGSKYPIMRAFKLIRLFEANPKGITISRIKEELGVHKDTARYWLGMASLALPIYEIGVEDKPKGRPGVLYALLNEERI